MAAKPIKDKYSNMPPDVAAVMRKIDADRATPAYKKSASHAAAAGGVTGDPTNIQSGGARAVDAARARAAIQAANAKETAGLQSALKGGLGGGLRGRATRLNRIVGRIK